MATVTICSDFGAPQNKAWHCFHCFPIYFPWSDGTDAMIFVFWMLSFKPTFSLSSFTFIKRLFSSSSLSAIRVVSSAYLRWLIFQLVLPPAQCFSWCTLHIKCSINISGTHEWAIKEIFKSKFDPITYVWIQTQQTLSVWTLPSPCWTQGMQRWKSWDF